MQSMRDDPRDDQKKKSTFFQKYPYDEPKSGWRPPNPTLTALFPTCTRAAATKQKQNHYLATKKKLTPSATKPATIHSSCQNTKCSAAAEETFNRQIEGRNYERDLLRAFLPVLPLFSFSFSFSLSPREGDLLFRCRRSVRLGEGDRLLLLLRR